MTTQTKPSVEVLAATAKLRAMDPGSPWGDKFYAALDALWWVTKGREPVAQGRPAHQVMADLIDDVAWSREEGAA